MAVRNVRVYFTTYIDSVADDKNYTGTEEEIKEQMARGAADFALGFADDLAEELISNLTLSTKKPLITIAEEEEEEEEEE